MKRYLSGIFIALSGLVIIIGNSLDIYWSGIASWGTGFVLLIFAAYFTKYIPDEKKKKTDQS